VGSAQLAARDHEYGSGVSSAEACIRNAGLHARGAKGGFAERAIARGNLANWSSGEGIFRNHMITASGRIRHSVYSSIIDSEWPAVRARLESKLNSREH